MADTTKQENHAQYLADGVYASFDGFHICLHVGDHRAKPVVLLDGVCLAALLMYVEKIKALPAK